MKTIKYKLKHLIGVLLILIGIAPFSSSKILNAQTKITEDNFVSRYYKSELTFDKFSIIDNLLRSNGYDYNLMPSLNFVMYPESLSGGYEDVIAYLLDESGNALKYDDKYYSIDLRCFQHILVDAIFTGPLLKEQTKEIGLTGINAKYYSGTVTNFSVDFTNPKSQVSFQYKHFNASGYAPEIIDLFNNDNYTLELEETLFFMGWNNSDWSGIQDIQSFNLKGSEYYLMLFDKTTMYSYLLKSVGTDAYQDNNLFPIDIRHFRYVYENPTYDAISYDQNKYRLFFVAYVDVEASGYLTQIYHYSEESLSVNNDEFLSDYYKEADETILNLYLTKPTIENLNFLNTFDGELYPFFVNNTPLPYADVNGQRYYFDLRDYMEVIIYKTKHGEIEYFKVKEYAPGGIVESSVRYCTTDDFFNINYVHERLKEIYKYVDEYDLYKKKKEAYNYPNKIIYSSLGVINPELTYDYNHTKHVCSLSIDNNNLCYEIDPETQEQKDMFFDLRDWSFVREYYDNNTNESLFYISGYNPGGDNSKSYTLFDYGDSDLKINIPAGKEYYMLYNFEIYEEKNLWQAATNISVSDIFGDGLFQSVDDSHYLYLFNIVDSPILPIMQTLDSVKVEYQGCQEEYKSLGQLLDKGKACKIRSEEYITINLKASDYVRNLFYYNPGKDIESYSSYANVPLVGEVDDLVNMYNDKIIEWKETKPENYNYYLDAHGLEDSYFAGYSLMGLVNPEMLAGMGGNAGFSDSFIADIFHNYDYYFIIPKSNFVAYQMILTASITTKAGSKVEYNVVHNNGLGDGSQTEPSWYETHVLSKVPDWMLSVLDWLEANWVMLALIILALFIIRLIPGMQSLFGWLFTSIFKGLFKAIWFIITWPFVTIYKLITNSNELSTKKDNDQLYMKIPIDEKAIKKMDDMFVYKEE